MLDRVLLIFDGLLLARERGEKPVATRTSRTSRTSTNADPAGPLTTKLFPVSLPHTGVSHWAERIESEV